MSGVEAVWDLDMSASQVNDRRRVKFTFTTFRRCQPQKHRKRVTVGLTRDESWPKKHQLLVSYTRQYSTEQAAFGGEAGPLKLRVGVSGGETPWTSFSHVGQRGRVSKQELFAEQLTGEGT